jgi:hypothetical protein
MAEPESREDELFLKANDVERTPFLGEYVQPKRRTFTCRNLVWVINATLLIVVLALLWERNHPVPAHRYRDQRVYCTSSDEG